MLGGRKPPMNCACAPWKRYVLIAYTPPFRSIKRQSQTARRVCVLWCRYQYGNAGSSWGRCAGAVRARLLQTAPRRLARRSYLGQQSLSGGQTRVLLAVSSSSLHPVTTEQSSLLPRLPIFTSSTHSAASCTAICSRLLHFPAAEL